MHKKDWTQMTNLSVEIYAQKHKATQTATINKAIKHLPIHLPEETPWTRVDHISVR